MSIELSARGRILKTTADPSVVTILRLNLDGQIKDTFKFSGSLKDTNKFSGRLNVTN